MFALRAENKLVFTQVDPKTDGYGGDVVSDVELYYPQEIHEWPDGSERPDPWIGRKANGVVRYRVFRSKNELTASGFDEVLQGTPVVVERWSDFLLGKVRMIYACEPHRAKEYVAINLQNGEMIVEKSWHETFSKFNAKWPNAPMLKTSVDGKARSARHSI